MLKNSLNTPGFPGFIILIDDKANTMHVFRMKIIPE